MRKKFIKSILIVFVLITQLSLLKAQTQEIDLSGQWGFQTDLMDFRRGSLDIRYASLAGEHPSTRDYG